MVATRVLHVSNSEKKHQIPNEKAAQQVTPCYDKVKQLPELWPITLIEFKCLF